MYVVFSFSFFFSLPAGDLPTGVVAAAAAAAATDDDDDVAVVGGCDGDGKPSDLSSPSLS